MLSEIRELFRLRVEGSGLKLTEIAAGTGIPQGYLSELKNGRKNLSLHHIIAASKFLGLYFSDFLPPHCIRPQTGASIGEVRFKSAVRAVVKAAEDMRKKYGDDFISAEKIAEIAYILAADEDSELGEMDAKTAIKTCIAMSNNNEK